MVLGDRGFGDLLTGTVVTQTRALCIIFGTAILLDCTNTGLLGGEVAFVVGSLVGLGIPFIPGRLQGGTGPRI